MSTWILCKHPVEFDFSPVNLFYVSLILSLAKRTVNGIGVLALRQNYPHWRLPEMLIPKRGCLAEDGASEEPWPEILPIAYQCLSGEKLEKKNFSSTLSGSRTGGLRI